MLQEELTFPEEQIFPIPASTLLVLRLQMPDQPSVACHNKGILVKLVEPIVNRHQKLAKIVAKSRKLDHTLKVFSLTFDTNAMGDSCPLQCYCSWLVPLEEWCLVADPINSFYGLPPSGNSLPFALWWGVAEKPGSERIRWLHVGDTCSFELPSHDFVRDYDQIHLLVAGIIPVDKTEGEEKAWDQPGAKYQV